MAATGAPAPSPIPDAVSAAISGPELSADERRARGKAARARVPRSEHANWQPASDRTEPITLLEQQAAARVPELVPIRYGRMLVSPFTFYRGAAFVMAADLAGTPDSGIRAQLCGDAHLSNFGGFASPERDLIFDLNDFDETLPGPWEWDVKRLAASLDIAGRDRNFDRKQRRGVVKTAVKQYRDAIRNFATMPKLAVWYARMDQAALNAVASTQADARVLKRMDKAAAKARTKDSIKAFGKLTHIVDGEPRIIADPPLIVPIEDLLDSETAQRFETSTRTLLDAYRSTLQGDRRRLLEGYRYAHMARKVVGVGSVGTRCWIVLLVGRDANDPLFLQMKEAPSSVLEPFVGASEYANCGQRVVEGQRLMQASSDIFLGWLENEGGIDGVQRDFYVRQLWDWKLSAAIETMDPEMMLAYARMCSWTLARAHARSGDAIAIGAYLGAGDTFDLAVTDFAEAYADQNEIDYARLMELVKEGRIQVQSGL